MGDWRQVDEGWGRRAVDFATLAEPSNCREYVALHHHLGVSEGDRLLDVACGAGLALELAGRRGARCAGIDAAGRLVAVAQDRNPDADVRVGDMHALPWEDGAFDVVTSFRGLWGTTPGALVEVHRVLAPGGQVGLTVWGHIKASSGAWSLHPLSLAEDPKVRHQAAMVALGRPGAGEAFLEAAGFTDIERVDLVHVAEFADPETYARALASSGPAFEAIAAVGEPAFRQAAEALARERVREGLPLRAEVALVGYLARKPAPSAADVGAEEPSAIGFLGAPPPSPAAQRLYGEDRDGDGYVTNVSRLWAHMPATLDGLADLMRQVTSTASLTLRQRAVLVAAAASTLGDSYCSLAWGGRLANETAADTAAAVIGGDDRDLDPGERALAGWARLVTADPNATRPADVDALRDAGFDDEQIFAITTYVALRLAFSTVNDALGVSPDPELAASAPAPVLAAVDFGRPIATEQA